MEIVRVIRHWFALPGAVRRAFPEPTLHRIGAVIAETETHHSGEIRLAVEASLPWSYLWRDAPARERAVMMFSKLRVWDTEHNNGVLVYVDLADKRVEIVADRGVAARVAGEDWKAIARTMREHFVAQDFEAGAINGVRAIGEQLARHYPLAAGERNPNQLPDAPVVL